MGFLVVYQGQFSPYKLPEPKRYDKINSSSESSALKELKDHEDDDFENILAAAGGQRNKNRRAAKAYQAASKESSPNRLPVKAYAKDLMSYPVKCLRERDTLELAKELVSKTGFRHFPVIDADGNLKGLLTERDLLSSPNGKLVEQAMSKKVTACLESASPQDMARIMLHEKIGCLPVLKGQGTDKEPQTAQVCGIVTVSDILRYVLESAVLDFRI